MKRQAKKAIRRFNSCSPGSLVKADWCAWRLHRSSKSFHVMGNLPLPCNLVGVVLAVAEPGPNHSSTYVMMLWSNGVMCWSRYEDLEHVKLP